MGMQVSRGTHLRSAGAGRSLAPIEHVPMRIAVLHTISLLIPRSCAPKPAEKKRSAFHRRAMSGALVSLTRSAMSTTARRTNQTPGGLVITESAAKAPLRICARRSPVTRSIAHLPATPSVEYQSSLCAVFQKFRNPYEEDAGDEDGRAPHVACRRGAGGGS